MERNDKNLTAMELIQLTSDYEMKPFDCGDAVLNGFLSFPSGEGAGGVS